VGRRISRTFCLDDETVAQVIAIYERSRDDVRQRTIGEEITNRMAGSLSVQVGW